MAQISASRYSLDLRRSVSCCLSQINFMQRFAFLFRCFEIDSFSSWSSRPKTAACTKAGGMDCVPEKYYYFIHGQPVWFEDMRLTALFGGIDAAPEGVALFEEALQGTGKMIVGKIVSFVLMPPTQR